jgi:hypothetical protein
MDLVEPLLDAGRGVTADNLFSSRQLALDLLARKTTYIGTVRKIRREVPSQFNDRTAIAMRAPESSEYLYSGDVTMLSYIPKPRRSVVLISTQHQVPEDGQDSRGKTKPKIMLDYNATKGTQNSA